MNNEEKDTLKRFYDFLGELAETIKQQNQLDIPLRNEGQNDEG